jgi:hypothetical protein
MEDIIHEGKGLSLSDELATVDEVLSSIARLLEHDGNKREIIESLFASIYHLRNLIVATIGDAKP